MSTALAAGAFPSVEEAQDRLCPSYRIIEPDPAQPKYLISEPWVGYRFVTEPADV